METIYKPETFHATENFEIEKYFKTYSELYSLMQNAGNFDENVVGNLNENCSIDLLNVPEEPSEELKKPPEKFTVNTEVNFVYPIIEKARHLHTVKYVESKQKIPAFKAEKIRGAPTLTQGVRYCITNMVEGETFICNILVYKPFSIEIARGNSDKLRLAAEIEVIGNNTLAEFVDKIDCMSNYGIYTEVENTKIDISVLRNAKDGYNPHLPTYHQTTIAIICDNELYPSQTLFIDGTFYNDFRHVNAIDYSEPIEKWAREKGIGKFTTSDMNEVKFKDLKPRFGYPYVYIHQGNCEHIIMFFDARLLQSNDCLHSRVYPQFVNVTRARYILCFMCNKYGADWFVRNCDRLHMDRVFLCTTCCDSFLYIDGEKVCNFQLYPYFKE